MYRKLKRNSSKGGSDIIEAQPPPSQRDEDTSEDAEEGAEAGRPRGAAPGARA